jgi:hypothetical protein
MHAIGVCLGLRRDDRRDRSQHRTHRHRVDSGLRDRPGDDARAPLRPLRDAGLGSRALAYLQLEHVPPQLNQGDSRGAEDGRGYRH